MLVIALFPFDKKIFAHFQFFAAMMSSFTLNCILSVFHGVGGFLSWNGLANFGVFEVIFTFYRQLFFNSYLISVFLLAIYFYNDICLILTNCIFFFRVIAITFGKYRSFFSLVFLVAFLALYSIF